MKPLLHIKWADFRRARCDVCESRDCGHGEGADVGFGSYYIYFYTFCEVKELDAILHQKWLRFKGGIGGTKTR